MILIPTIVARFKEISDSWKSTKGGNLRLASSSVRFQFSRARLSLVKGMFFTWAWDDLRSFMKVSVILVSCTFTNMLYIIVQPSTQNVMQNVFKKCCIQELLVFVNATVTGEHAWV